MNKLLKYPIEIELTDFCGFNCKSCINYLLENKGFISLNKYIQILNYIFNNKDNILYINFGGIGDIFLHEDIELLLNIFITKFKNTGINVLIPTKGQSFKKEYIYIFHKFKNNGINTNISIGIFSMIRNKQKFLIGGSNNGFQKTLDFMNLLRKNNIKFSLELLKGKNTSKIEEKMFKNFCNKLNIDGIISNYHNFGGLLKKNEFYGISPCSFSGENYLLNNFYCTFIPFISKNGNIYSCSISGKNKSFFVGRIEDLFLKYPNYLDMVFFIQKKFLNSEKCKDCSMCNL